MRVAAVQLEPVVADVAANLEACERLADQAAARGAKWIMLPEFFTTGMGFVPELAEAALAPDGAATDLLLDLARRHAATVGGSFVCRDPDGHTRNAYLLVTPEGAVGRHDKDIPTMWENAFYVGGADDGVLSTDGLSVGVAMCWELMRTQTARRLRERVDVVVGGSCWWSIPSWPPQALTRRLEAGNARLAARAVPAMARQVGAPVIHAAHCGPVECAFPWTPIRYRGHYQGGTSICDGAGALLAVRGPRDGPGVVVADVEPGRRAPLDEPPDRFWLHRRDPASAFVWAYQRIHGRRWYSRHVAGRPPLRLPRESREPAPTEAH